MIDLWREKYFISWLSNIAFRIKISGKSKLRVNVTVLCITHFLLLTASINEINNAEFLEKTWFMLLTFQCRTPTAMFHKFSRLFLIWFLLLGKAVQPEGFLRFLSRSDLGARQVNSLFFFLFLFFFFFLSSRKYNPGCLSRIRIFYPSRIPDPWVKKALDPGSETLFIILAFFGGQEYYLDECLSFQIFTDVWIYRCQ